MPDYDLHAQLAKFIRKKRGDMTYAEFSRKTGLSIGTLNRMELRLQNVTLKTMEQLIKRLKCKMSDIFE